MYSCTRSSARVPSLEALHALYPASAYDARRVAARDAALAFAARSSPVAGGIPLAGDEFTYGEFDISFLARLLDQAGAAAGDEFVDIGSGAGRVVLASALLHPELAQCHGIEILPELHSLAISARQNLDRLPPPLSEQPIAPCEFSCFDVYSEAAAEALSTADVLFSYSLTWARDADGRLTALSNTLARLLKPGSRIITVGVTLLPSIDEVRFEPVATLNGANVDTGQDSRGHIFRVVHA